MSECLCFCSNDVFMTLSSLFPLCTSLKSAEETHLIAKVCAGVWAWSSVCSLQHVNMRAERKQLRCTAVPLLVWTGLKSLLVFILDVLHHWLTADEVSLTKHWFITSVVSSSLIRWKDWWSLSVWVNIQECVERGSAGSWWSIWTGVWIWILSSSLKSLNWVQTEQLSLDVVESALYRCVLHELFDAEKSKNRCYKSDCDPGPIFIKRLRITLRVNED